MGHLVCTLLAPGFNRIDTLPNSLAVTTPFQAIGNCGGWCIRTTEVYINASF